MPDNPTNSPPSNASLSSVVIKASTNDAPAITYIEINGTEVSPDLFLNRQDPTATSSLIQKLKIDENIYQQLCLTIANMLNHSSSSTHTTD